MMWRLLAFLFVWGLFMHWLPYLLLGGVVVGGVWLTLRSLAGMDARIEGRRRRAAELAARAVTQDTWYLQGDPRGTYG